MKHVSSLQRMVQELTGNIISAEKAGELLTRLHVEAPERGVSEILDEFARWKALPNWLKSELTVGETFFFRHPQHLDLLAARLRESGKTRGFRVLCAGVSSGEEAYSVAIALHDVAPGSFEIVGLDINPSAVERARTGVYPEDAVERAPASHRRLLERQLELVPDPTRRLYRINDALRSTVRFVEGNVVGFPLSKYDAVFVRNILIYFAPAERERILLTLFGRVEEGGLLFIGAGEVFPPSLRAMGAVGPPSVLRRLK